MVQYLVDIHPRYQAGINIERIAAEGFIGMAVKVSEGTATYGGLPWIERGKRAGMLCVCYHYLRPGNEIRQAEVFASQLKAVNAPGMLDAEAIDNHRNATLTVGMVGAFLAACRNLRVHVPLLYLPRWYWDRMRRPSLAGLGVALWASSYPSRAAGYASDLYQRVDPPRWESYGGLPVEVLQFSDRGRVAGKEIDVNAYRGTRVALARLLGLAEEDDVSLSQEHERLLREVHAKLHQQIPTRAGPGPEPAYRDDMLGYACNADGFGFRNEQRLIAIKAALAALTAVFADKHGLDAETMRAVFMQELAKAEGEAAWPPGGGANL